jgi:hypothetical protein
MTHMGQFNGSINNRMTVKSADHNVHNMMSSSVELMNDDGNDDVYNLKPPPPLLPSV